MTHARLIEVTRTQTADGVLVSYRFEFNGRRQEVWFRVSEFLPAGAAETFLAFALLPAMKVGADIIVESPSSEQVLRNAGTIQNIFACWLPQTFRRVSIRAPAAVVPAPVNAQVGCFFSGGVDSFYTLLKHSKEITTLLLVHGFDLKLSDTASSLAVSSAVREIAGRFNKRVVEIQTNVREFSNAHMPWDVYHGSALAAVGLLLSPLFSRIYIAASHTYCELMPWGSHPLLDSLWSTEQLEFAHDGCEATRVEKVAAITKSSDAMKTLRVCWRKSNGAYNCGECDKCLRTMVNLYLAGALGRCITLPAKLDFKRIALTRIEGESARAFAHENLRALRARGSDPQLIKAIEDSLAGRYHHGIRRIPRKLRRWVGRKFLIGSALHEHVAS